MCPIFSQTYNTQCLEKNPVKIYGKYLKETFYKLGTKLEKSSDNYGKSEIWV